MSTQHELDYEPHHGVEELTSGPQALEGVQNAVSPTTSHAKKGKTHLLTTRAKGAVQPGRVRRVYIPLDAV
ncbi:hypothetical protein OH76DRAFT_1403351 [Lentinus brumalis]|uniref:Uncharacterized protein n=1 Tax=Lentinus brumalis TaxID=2498619 RepID=A0A371DB41_9APHY|nr:hypothetical protein OH76DRAFT_1403351 [Polyporus brumalis]